jgi:hypothetical protein
MSNVRIEITRVYDLAALLAKENNVSSAPASWQGQICAAHVTASLSAGPQAAMRELFLERSL